MNKQEISETYGINIEVLNKMEEDSKTGSLFRKYSQIFNGFYVIEIIFRNGELETKIKGVGNPVLMYEGKPIRYIDFLRMNKNEHQ